METYKNNRQLVLHFLKGSKRFFALSLTFATPPEVPRIAELLIERLGGIGALKAHPLFIACAVAAIGALAALSRFLFRTMNARGAETFVCTMREELFSHIMYLPYAWHEKNSTGDIIQRCTSDVQTIKRFVSEQMRSSSWRGSIRAYS